jgi:hypothetical protein
VVSENRSLYDILSDVEAGHAITWLEAKRLMKFTRAFDRKYGGICVNWAQVVLESNEVF